MTRLLLPALLAVLPACSVLLEEHNDSATFSPDLSEIDRVELRNGSGNVTVRASAEVQLDADIWWLGDEAPTIDFNVLGDTLIIDTRCESLPFGGCSVDWEMGLPPELSLDLETGSGDVEVWTRLGDAIISTGSGNVDVDDLSGDLDIDTGSGDVLLGAIDGDLKAKTGSGNIDADGVTGHVDLSTGSGDVYGRSLCAETLKVRTGSGNVDVQACRAPDSTDIDTGSGDVEVVVPSGSYRIETSTGSGDITIEDLSDSRQSDRLLRASTGSGNIGLRGE